MKNGHGGSLTPVLRAGAESFNVKLRILKIIKIIDFKKICLLLSKVSNLTLTPFLISILILFLFCKLKTPPLIISMLSELLIDISKIFEQERAIA